MREEIRGRRTRVIKSTLALGMAAALLTACGSVKTGTLSSEAAADEPAAAVEAYDTAAGAAYYDGGMAMASSEVITNEAAAEEVSDDYAEEAVEEPAAEGGGQNEVTEPQTTERKLIKTVDISAETEEFDTLVPGLQKQVEALGGYIENNQVYEISSYYVDDHLEKQRCANITARVPKEKLDGFLAQIGEQTNVKSRSESVEDVTLQYVDLESHKKALLTEQERLMELLAQAESVEDIIAIEGRLSEVRYQLESMESQLRTYDNRIDYSTVYLSIEEVRKYSASYDASVGERIAKGFVKSIEDIGFGIRDFAIGFVIDIPYIILWGVIIVLAVLVLRVLWKAWRKRAEKKQACEGMNGRTRRGSVHFRWPVAIGSGKNERTKDRDSDTEQKEQKTDGE